MTFDRAKINLLEAFRFPKQVGKQQPGPLNPNKPNDGTKPNQARGDKVQGGQKGPPALVDPNLKQPDS